MMASILLIPLAVVAVLIVIWAMGRADR